MTNFTDYLTTIDNPVHREQLTEVLLWINNQYPQLTTEVKWNQPMFIDHGTFIIAFSVAKNHFSVAPEAIIIAQFSQDIKEAGYDHTANLFKIKWNQDVDYALLKKIIDFNIADKINETKFWR